MPKAKPDQEEMTEKFNQFLGKFYEKDLMKASNEGKPLIIDFKTLD